MDEAEARDDESEIYGGSGELGEPANECAQKSEAFWRDMSAIDRYRAESLHDPSAFKAALEISAASCLEMQIHCAEKFRAVDAEGADFETTNQILIASLKAARQGHQMAMASRRDARRGDDSVPRKPEVPPPTGTEAA